MNESLQNDIIGSFGEGSYSQSEAVLQAYARDCLPLTTRLMLSGAVSDPPAAVILPENADDVAKAFEISRKHEVPIVCYGGGSGVCGGAAAGKGWIVLDVKRMDRILEIDEVSQTATAETGINGALLEEKLNARGYTLGHFPSSIMCSTLGGWLAARSSGQMSTKYGSIEHMCIGLDAVMFDGSRYSSARVPRTSLGPDFKELLIGSEGTLGVITSATLNLKCLPESREFRAYHFASLADAIAAMRGILQAGIKPSAMRLYDKLDTRISSLGKEHSEDKKPSPVKAVAKFVREHMPFVYTEALEKGFDNARLLNELADRYSKALLLILVFDGAVEIAKAEEAKARAIVGTRGVDLGPKPAEDWLKKRYDVSFKLSRVFEIGAFAETLEVATTWANLENLYAKVKAALAESAIVLAHFSHAYNSGCNIYFTFAAYEPAPAKVEELYYDLVERALSACHDVGGTVAHHHGVGYTKRKWMSLEHGPAERMLRAMKREFDPKNLLNPGKMISD
ncbi:MAG: FAD-binding oxidoreductase [Planctomycetes bacterium]|nr:FAD-binding oxidoreductase [Planctomycetota bacterium]